MNSITNQQTLNLWYQEFSNDIYKFILYIVHDHEQAEDLMHDTFLRAYNNLHSFDGESPKSWLFKIARNIVIDFMRRKKPLSFLFDSYSNLPAPGLSPEQSLALNEQEKELYFTLTKLKRTYREVIVLRKIKEFSVEDTATILGWSEGKVKTNLWRAMSSLKKELEKEGFQHESI